MLSSITEHFDNGRIYLLWPSNAKWATKIIHTCYYDNMASPYNPYNWWHSVQSCASLPSIQPSFIAWSILIPMLWKTTQVSNYVLDPMLLLLGHVASFPEGVKWYPKLAGERKLQYIVHVSQNIAPECSTYLTGQVRGIGFVWCMGGISIRRVW